MRDRHSSSAPFPDLGCSQNPLGRLDTFRVLPYRSPIITLHPSHQKRLVWLSEAEAHSRLSGRLLTDLTFEGRATLGRPVAE